MISIIIPVYNAERYLDCCLKSVLEQTYKDFECIIVDNNSTDRSVEIANKFVELDDRMKLVTCTKLGVSNARNAGLKSASGEYIMFVDSDDYIDRCFCSKMLQTIEGTAADMVICGIRIVDKDELYKYSWNVTPQLDNKLISDISEILPILAQCKMLNNIFNKIYRYRLIKSGFHTGYTIAEDLDFNLKYLNECNSVCIIRDEMYYYRSMDSLTDEKIERYVESQLDTMTQIFQDAFVLYRSKIKTLNVLKKIYARNLLNCFSELAKFKSFNLLCNRIKQVTDDEKIQKSLRNVRIGTVGLDVALWLYRKRYWLFLACVCRLKLFIQDFRRG